MNHYLDCPAGQDLFVKAESLGEFECISYEYIFDAYDVEGGIYWGKITPSTNWNSVIYQEYSDTSKCYFTWQDFHTTESYDLKPDIRVAGDNYCIFEFLSPTVNET